MGRLDGKVALISGAARGLGRSHAVALAREGADIVVFDISEELSTLHATARSLDLDETARLVEAAGRRVLAMHADVRDTASLEAVVAETLNMYGHIDIVVANAGIDSFGSSLTITDEAWDQMIAVNLTGSFKTVRAAIPAMIEYARGGAIVLTSSCAGLIPYPHHVHYVASKFGVVGLMKALALELAHYRIRVNALAPGPVRTDMLVNPTLREVFTGNPNATEQELASVFKEFNLIDEPWIEPDDVSSALVWLVSDEARYVTGVALPIDLGQLIKGPFDARSAAASVSRATGHRPVEERSLEG